MKTMMMNTNYFNKVKAAVLTVAIALAIPALAGPRQYHYSKHDKSATEVIAHRHHAHRPVVKECSFKVSHRASPKYVIAKAERLPGVVDARWNPSTRKVTVRYDARLTTARHIRHSMT